MKGGDQLGGLLKKSDSLAVVREVVLFLYLCQPVVHLIFALVQQAGKGVPAIGFDKFVRVFGPLHPQDLHRQPRLFQNGNGPLGSFYSGPVSVVGDDSLLIIPG